MKAHLLGAGLILAGVALAASPLLGRVRERIVQAEMLRTFETTQAQIQSQTQEEVQTRSTQAQAQAPSAQTVAVPQPAAPTDPYRIDIPAVGISDMVLNGLDDEHLAQGPAHYAETPQPGLGGNAAIAGHRTVRGQPSFFYDLNRVKPGDSITITYATQRFTYTVERVYLTNAYDRTVLDPTSGDALTLTTCDPPGTSDQRLIVRAVLQSAGAP